MLKTTFVLICLTIMKLTAVKQIRKHDTFTFVGFDCNKPIRLNSYKKSEWCMPMALHENPKGDVNIKMTIVQKFGSQIGKGIKGSRRTSKFFLNCRTYGYQKYFWTSNDTGARKNV